MKALHPRFLVLIGGMMFLLSMAVRPVVTMLSVKPGQVWRDVPSSDPFDGSPRRVYEVLDVKQGHVLYRWRYISSFSNTEHWCTNSISTRLFICGAEKMMPG